MREKIEKKTKKTLKKKKEVKEKKKKKTYYVKKSPKLKLMAREFKKVLRKGVEFPAWMRDHPSDCTFNKFYEEAVCKNYRAVAEIKKDCTWLMRNQVPCQCPHIQNFNKLFSMMQKHL